MEPRLMKEMGYDVLTLLLDLLPHQPLTSPPSSSCSTADPGPATSLSPLAQEAIHEAMKSHLPVTQGRTNGQSGIEIGIFDFSQ